MAPIPFNTVAFDLDGTLADTAPDLASALNSVLDDLGRPHIPVAEVRVMIGNGARALLHRGLVATGDAPEELVDRSFALFLERYRHGIARLTRPYPGVDAALDRLAEDGIALAVCTNKLEWLTFPLLEALGWKERFCAIVGGDTLPVRKPDPAPLHEAIARAGGGRAAFVGDTITDAATARAAGIPFIAVSFGFADRPIEQFGAQAVIDDYADLHAALQRTLAS